MRFELPAEKKLVHEMLMPLRWGDMDAMGHINNTLYFRYMEVCRLDWIFKLGVDDNLGDRKLPVWHGYRPPLRCYPRNTAPSLAAAPVTLSAIALSSASS